MILKSPNSFMILKPNSPDTKKNTWGFSVNFKNIKGSRKFKNCDYRITLLRH